MLIGRRRLLLKQARLLRVKIVLELKLLRICQIDGVVNLLDLDLFGGGRVPRRLPFTQTTPGRALCLILQRLSFLVEEAFRLEPHRQVLLMAHEGAVLRRDSSPLRAIAQSISI